MNPIKINWAPILGRFEISENLLVFKGGSTKRVDQEGEHDSPAIGNLICNREFSGGTIEAKVELSTLEEGAGCEIIVGYNPTNRVFLSAGLGGHPTAAYTVRIFDATQGKWTHFLAMGERENIETGREYKLRIRLRGTILELWVDGVLVGKPDLGISLAAHPAGVWCRGTGNIFIRDYSISLERPRAFVVMQFSTPFNELYSEVLKPICEQVGVDAVRVDEVHNPGLIMADIISKINEAKFVIGEITALNQNVFYELGYAHGRGKPTILLAEKGKVLPLYAGRRRGPSANA